MSTHKRTLERRLIWSFSVAPLCVIAAAFLGYGLLWSIISQDQKLISIDDANVRSVLVMEVEFKEQVQEWKDVLLRGSDPQQFEKYWMNFQKKETDIQARGKQLLTRIADPGANALLEEFLKTHQTLGERYRDGLQRYKEGGFDAKVGDKAVKGVDRAPTEKLHETVTLLVERSTQAAEAVRADALHAILWTAFAMGMAVIVATVFVTLHIRRSIIRPVRELMTSMTRLAEGDFETPIQISSESEFGHIADAARAVRQQLGQVLLEVAVSMKRLSETAHDLMKMSEEFSQEIQIQKTETDHVASATHEMSTTVHEISRLTVQAAKAMQEADDETRNGKAVVKDTMIRTNQLANDIGTTAQVIARLGVDSDSIGKVLDVIRAIAEQTNLLALNAAIEAARAGEQGRGFAVVADEVRNLAHRTQQSTREIQQMIESLQRGAREAVQVMEGNRQQVEENVARANQANDSLESIARAVGDMTARSAEIASITEQQSVTAEQINRNIMTIAQVADKTTVGVQRTTAASQELVELSMQLKTLMAKFRLPAAR